MKRSILLSTLVLSVALFSFQPASIFFYKGSYDNFLREAKKQNKPIILDFWASWCAPCKKMDKETFNDPALISYINENFYIYKVNIDTFDGIEIANKFNVESFPTLLILNSKGAVKKELKGFYPADYLLKELQAPKPNLVSDSFVKNK